MGYKVVEKHSPGLCEVLGSAPSTASEEEEGRRKGERQRQGKERERERSREFGISDPWPPSRGLERTARPPLGLTQDLDI